MSFPGYPMGGAGASGVGGNPATAGMSEQEQNMVKLVSCQKEENKEPIAWC